MHPLQLFSVNGSIKICFKTYKTCNYLIKMHPSRSKTVKRVHKMTRIRKIKHKQSLKNGHKMLPIIIKTKNGCIFRMFKG